MTRRWRWMAAALVASILSISVVIALAQAPNIPKGHVPIPATSNAATCFECHQTPQMPTPEKSSFCGTCHVNKHIALSKREIPVTRVAPRPAHPLDFNWTGAECATCHTTPHKTKIAKHPVTTAQLSGSFCQPCHQTPVQPDKGITGKEKAGEFCAPCHNIGLVADHVKTPDGSKAQFCYQCHKEDK